MNGQAHLRPCGGCLPINAVIALPLEESAPLEDLAIVRLAREQAKASLDRVFLGLERPRREGRSEQIIINIDVCAHNVDEVCVLNTYWILFCRKSQVRGSRNRHACEGRSAQGGDSVRIEPPSLIPSGRMTRQPILA